MEEEGHRLHRGLQQAQRQRGPQVARDGIGHQGGDANVDHVVAACFHQHGFVLAGSAADVGHGGLFFTSSSGPAVVSRDVEMVVILNSVC